MQRQPGRAGFSLIELLISMGIMVVGLVMAGTLFPAAIKQTSRSVDDTIGTIICQNALAVAMAKLTHTDVDTAIDAAAIAATVPVWPNFVNVTWPATPLITEAELAYPVPRTPIATYSPPITGPAPDDPLADWWPAVPNSRPTADHGAIVLARQVRPDENDYQLVVISYKKKIRVSGNEPHQNVVIARAIQVTLVNEVDKDYTTIIVAPVDLESAPGANDGLVKRGTAIILDEDDIDGDGGTTTVDDFMYGVFAKLVTIDQDTGEGRLDMRLPEHRNYTLLDGLYFPEGIARNNINVWVVYEEDSTTNIPVGSTSPTMSVFMTRTAFND